MTLTAVLFTGGSSRRMGADKAGLIFDGEPLWSRQLRLLRELRPDALWISARSRPAWCPPEIEVVLDVPPSHGPLSGLSAALSRLQTSHLLVLAVDLPQMTAAHLRKLWSLARPGCGVLPMAGEYFEPLCAIYPASAASAAKDALTSDDLSLHSLAQNLVQKKHAL
jgi:molybdopterin-guanine dinucleotide biosynthesis protein A